MDDHRRGHLSQLPGVSVGHDSGPTTACCENSVVAIPFKKLQEHAGGQIHAASVVLGDTGASGQNVPLPGTAVSVVRTQDSEPDSACVANPNALQRVASLERPGTRGSASPMQRLRRKILGGASLEKNEAFFSKISAYCLYAVNASGCLLLTNFYFQAETQRAVLVESSPSGTHDVEQWPKVLLKPQRVTLDKRNKRKAQIRQAVVVENTSSLSLSRAFSLSLSFFCDS
jgi:hypothetical protein